LLLLVVNFGCWLPLILAPHIIIYIGVILRPNSQQNKCIFWNKTQDTLIICRENLSSW